MRSVKVLIREGKLDPDLAPDVLEGVGGACVAVTVGRLFSTDEQPIDALREFVRAVGRIAARDASIAIAMLSKICFLGPADTADSIRRLVHDLAVDGSVEILKLDLSKTSLKKAAKVAL